MDRLILENFRCFKQYQEVPIKPITVLVGENSTGKSSFLAAIRIAADLVLPWQRLDFNEPPFDLGAYEQIASYSLGKPGRAKSFTLGFEVDEKGQGRKSALAVTGQFVPLGSQPVVDELRIQDESHWVSAKRGDNQATVEFQTGPRDQPASSSKTFPVPKNVLPDQIVRSFFSYIYMVSLGPSRGTDPRESLSPHLSRMLRRLLDSEKSRPQATAPVRTRPFRSYDPKSEVPMPEGGHVPMVLAKLSSGDGEEGDRIEQWLTKFGEPSGLFRKLRIRRLGPRQSDPFQVRVTIAGPPDNLVDVGYGVSQVLPILVDPLLAKGEQTFLLQQPEVHLHPRAQAELGTYLSNIANERKHRFVIETHSDYLIDRLRLDIRDKKGALPSSDVIVLYFERDQRWVKIHPITIDQDGHLKDAPAGYRGFFLREEARLFKV